MTVQLADIEEAATRMKGFAVRTPLLQSPRLNEDCGRRIFIKPEPLQRTGSFKFRGAFNRLSRLSDEERAAGVVTWSSGNHAQGVAAAARMVGARAAIVMPTDAPSIKIDNTKRLGGEIIFYDRYKENREEIARRISAERGAVLVPSYDDASIIAGQGTTGLEICEDLHGLNAAIDAALICCGGGGLIAGSAIAIKAKSAQTSVYAVEPEGYDDHARSLASGTIQQADTSRPSICDALLAPQPGALTYPINSAVLAGGLVVSEDDVKEAMRYAFHTLKLIVEPGGAVALAALLSGKTPDRHKNIAIVLSGGNVDAKLFAEIIASS